MTLPPSLLASAVPILATAGVVFIPVDLIFGFHYLGEHLNVTSLISSSGVAVAAWVRLFQRQEVWNSAQERIMRYPDTKRPTRIRREITYTYDYFNITRTLRERRMDRALETAKVARYRDTWDQMKEILDSHNMQKAENFVRESFPKLRR